MSILGTILGVLVGYFMSYYFHKKASDNLEKQANKLKLASDLMLYKLQQPNAKTLLKTDEDGDVIGLKVTMD